MFIYSLLCYWQINWLLFIVSDYRKSACRMSEICCSLQNIVTSATTVSTDKPTVTVSSSDPDSASDCGMRNSGQEISNRIVSPDRKCQIEKRYQKIFMNFVHHIYLCYAIFKLWTDLKNTSFGEFPWMALLLTAEIDPATQQRLENVFVCGASLISSKIVLTAGHCV